MYVTCVRTAFKFVRPLTLTEIEAYFDWNCGLGERHFYEEALHRLRCVEEKAVLYKVNANQGPSSLQTFDLDVVIQI